jgi:F-type H+-transporting ATPase subunit delta
VSAVIASRYAKALMNLAAKGGQVEPVAQGLDEIAALLRDSTTLSALLADVRVTRAAKERVVKGVLERAGLPELVNTFVLFIMNKRRLALLAEIAAHFHRLADERLGRAQAQVTVAAPLAPEQEQGLTGELERISGKTITLQVHVDSAILGGAITRVGSTVWDGSLRTQLNQLRETIVKG